MNPTSTAGLPIPPHGDGSTNQIRPDEAWGRLLPDDSEPDRRQAVLPLRFSLKSIRMPDGDVLTLSPQPLVVLHTPIQL